MNAIVFIVFIAIALIILFLIIYRKNNGMHVYKYVTSQVAQTYNKYIPYSFKTVRDAAKKMGYDYSVKRFTTEAIIMGAAAFGISFLYFYSIIRSAIYAAVAIAFVPYLAYLRYKRVYSEFIFEQVQVYTTNIIMEFATSQSFVKSLEGVYESGVLEEPFKSDVKIMIDMAYDNGTIEESIKYLNEKYDYYIIRNLHQLFLQITNEGSKNSGPALENMSLDIDMLVENVYSDRLKRADFHKKFIQFGIGLYLMVMLVQLLLKDSYTDMLKQLYMRVLLHGVLIINSFFLINGEKYYNENVGAE